MSTENDPVERKVQLTGGSTYTVSLPKNWADLRDITPGTVVALHLHDTQLVITERDAAKDRRVVTINAIEHDDATVALAVAAAYVAGCEEIHVKAISDTQTRRAVSRVITRFIGLEVMAETERTLAARTMLDVADLSAEQTVTQIERTALEMHAQAVRAVTTADSTLGEQVAQQDDDVDRLFALLSREFQQSLVDPAITVDGHLTPFDYYMAGRQLERVADHAEKMAGLAARVSSSPPSDIVTALSGYGERSRTLVRQALAGLLAENNLGELTAVVTEADALLADLADLDEQLYDRSLTDGYILGLVVDSLIRTTQYAVNIAEAGVQAAYR